MKYEPIIGLEVHIELKTKSKMFCCCSAEYFGAKPNTHTCPVCLGLPGSLPVPNKKAIEYCAITGMALNCKILPFSKFDRKNYFYPDLPKGYQISQYDKPLAVSGQLKLKIKNQKSKIIRINRVHLEEDTGKLIHTTIKGEKWSLIDFNRAGVPLMEIVTEPDFRSAEEVRLFAKKIRQIVRYLEVSEADLEKGQMRFEANVSLRETKNRKFETQSLPEYKIEIKNINSIRFLDKAITYEIERQTKLLEKGKKLTQETRGWDEKKQITVSQREKEAAHDYRYFPEPDIPPIRWSKEELNRLKAQIPELPDEKRARFITWFDLTPNEAGVLTEDRSLADWYEEALRAYVQTVWPGIDIGRKRPKAPLAISAYAKPLANWVLGELLRRLKETSKKLEEIPLTPAHLAELLYLVDKGEISKTTAKEVFFSMFETGRRATTLIRKRGLGQISNEKILGKVIEKVLGKNQKAVSDYIKGKTEVLEFLVGCVMDQTQGKADPKKVRELLLESLKKLS